MCDVVTSTGMLATIGWLQSQVTMLNLQLHCGIRDFHALSPPFIQVSDNSVSDNTEIKLSLNDLVSTFFEGELQINIPPPPLLHHEYFWEAGLSLPVEVQTMTLVTDEDVWEVASSIPLEVKMVNRVMIGTNYWEGSSSFSATSSSHLRQVKSSKCTS